MYCMHIGMIKSFVLAILVGINMRDIKVLENYKKNSEKKSNEMKLFRNLKKEVNHGANGTQKYVIKKGINKGKVL